MLKAEEDFESQPAAAISGGDPATLPKANPAVTASALAEIRAGCRRTARDDVGVDASGIEPPMAATAPEPARAPAPPPSPAPPSPAPAPAPATRPWLNDTGRCTRITVYVQIYGPADRDAVRDLRGWWDAWGANVPPVEDVDDSARRTGRASPRPVSQTVLRYHDGASRGCAAAIQEAVNQAATGCPAADWRIEPLAKGLQGTPGVVELWVAPGNARLAALHAQIATDFTPRAERGAPQR